MKSASNSYINNKHTVRVSTSNIPNNTNSNPAVANKGGLKTATKPNTKNSNSSPLKSNIGIKGESNNGNVNSNTNVPDSTKSNSRVGSSNAKPAETVNRNSNGNVAKSNTVPYKRESTSKTSSNVGNSKVYANGNPVTHKFNDQFDLEGMIHGIKSAHSNIKPLPKSKSGKSGQK